MIIDKVLFFILVTANSIDAQSYIAAVIEYAPTVDTSLTAEQNVLRNTQRYVEFMAQARSQSANIIVFPEHGLTTISFPSNLSTVSTSVPQASLRIAPCDITANFSKFFIDLSCGAREHGIHTVVNLIESELRNSSNGTITTLFYNTNVVFDGTGAVIAKYRKINLFNEPMLTAGTQVVTFTAFEVTFGLMTCFDIVFNRPSQQIFNSGVTDIIYTMAWPSETPFTHALSVQDGYAKASGINMLVSGYNNVTAGMVGAGIFLANGTIATHSIESAAVQNMIVSTVTRTATRTPEAVCTNNIDMSTRIGGTVPDLTTTLNIIYENMENYTFQALETNVSLIQGVICSEGSTFCCNYTVEFNSPLTSNSTVYKIAAFHGRRALPGFTLIRTLGIRVCALVACTSNANSDCGRLNGTTNVNFRTITIAASLDANNSIYQPTTLTFNHIPLTNYAYCTNREADVLNVTMTVRNPQSVFSFGIYGREYARDGEVEGRGGANAIQFSLHAVVAIVSVYFCLAFMY